MWNNFQKRFKISEKTRNNFLQQFGFKETISLNDAVSRLNFSHHY